MKLKLEKHKECSLDDKVYNAFITLITENSIHLVLNKDPKLRFFLLEIYKHTLLCKKHEKYIEFDMEGFYYSREKEKLKMLERNIIELGSFCLYNECNENKI